MTLKDLVKSTEVISVSGDPNAEISGIAYNSAQVKSGFLFVAIPGLKRDGHTFVKEAVERGAVAVIGEKRLEALAYAVPGSVCYVQVKSSRRALAEVANVFYGYPSRKFKLIGITGTNGKTTTSFLVENIIACWEKSPGVIGTINYRFAGIEEKAPVTTPESLDLQELLARMLQHGVSHVVMEVSSHALDMGRVWGCDFDIAVFTNLSQDHLDYHENLDNYFNCKLRLFCDHLAASKAGDPVAVINIDDRYGASIPHESFYRVITYSMKKDADISPRWWKTDSGGIVGTLRSPIGDLAIRASLIGHLNLYNIMAAVGIAIALGVPSDFIEAGIARVERVSGRLESIPNNQGISVIIDYAHTPDAMEKALQCVREFTGGRLTVVFGCGGDRDRTKRPLMGEIAGRYGDLVIITSDNPRSEDPIKIIKDIENGVERIQIPFLGETRPGARRMRGYVIEPDRGLAIRKAVAWARPGDTVYIGGKGHEDYQIFADRRIHFDDKEEARRALEQREASGFEKAGTTCWGKC